MGVFVHCVLQIRLYIKVLVSLRLDIRWRDMKLSEMESSLEGDDT